LEAATGEEQTEPVISSLIGKTLLLVYYSKYKEPKMSIDLYFR
jgi:hypothetical protein